jgi:hypothetical protein
MAGAAPIVLYEIVLAIEPLNVVVVNHPAPLLSKVNGYPTVA